MKKHLNTTNNQTFNTAFIAQTIKAYLQDPKDPRARAICERVLDWIALTVVKRGIGRYCGDIFCETIAERAAKRLLNGHLGKNDVLRELNAATDAPVILRLLFSVCDKAVADQVYEVHRRQLDKRQGEEITIAGSLPDGAVPAELAVQPHCVSREFEINEALERVPETHRPTVKAALAGKTQRQIAKEHTLSVAEVNKRLQRASRHTPAEPQP